MQVVDVLRSKQIALVTISADRPLKDAIGLMAARQVGSAIAIDKTGRPLGIITEPDIVRRVAANGEAGLREPLREIMLAPAPVCAPEDTVAEALAQMTRTRVRYLLAMRGDAVLGLVSIGDLVKARLESTELESRVLRDMARGAVLARP